MIQIGPYTLPGKAVLAPMAGVTDFPFRKLCLKFGAAMATGEMTSSNPALRHTLKSVLRRAQPNEQEPRSVQIVGTEARQMAEAAIYQAEAGAQIIDINMGCPAKKVCRKLAGSALLKNEPLVADILNAVVGAVNVPVTLKIRTGQDSSNRNALSIARIAEDSGIQALAIHGRSRACKFKGNAEYDTIAEVASRLNIPVLANGDINSAQQAQQVLAYTGASGVMVGRGAQGRPWLFQEINELLGDSDVDCGLFTGKSLNLEHTKWLEGLIIEHVQQIHRYYDLQQTRLSALLRKSAHGKLGDSGNFRPNLAIRVARKHVCWYFEQIKRAYAEQRLESRTKNSSQVVLATADACDLTVDTARKHFNQLADQTAQLDYLKQFFGDLRTGDIAA
jgi:tRNA-dihydrouridine synthase B